MSTFRPLVRWERCGLHPYCIRHSRVESVFRVGCLAFKSCVRGLLVWSPKFSSSAAAGPRSGNKKQENKKHKQTPSFAPFLLAACAPVTQDPASGCYWLGMQPRVPGTWHGPKPSSAHPGRPFLPVFRFGGCCRMWPASMGLVVGACHFFCSSRPARSSTRRVSRIFGS